MGNNVKTKSAAERQVTTKATTLRDATESELLEYVIANDNQAWMELLRRYGRGVRGAIRSVLKKYGALLDSDAHDEILQTFYLRLLENDRRRLRVFKSAQSKLSTWLNMLAWQAAINHVRPILTRPRNIDLDELLDQEDYDAGEEELVEGRRATAKTQHDVLDAHVWRKAAQAAKKEGER